MFKMTIWQGGEADTVTASLSELNEFAKKLMASASIALQENAPRNPSDDACRYCQAQVDVLRCTSNSLRWWVVTLRILPTRPN